MFTRSSFVGLSFRVWVAFFAAVCILAPVNAYAADDDTVYLYYDDVFQTSGKDVGTVLNSGYQGYILKITGPATHSQKVTTSGLSIYGIGGKQTINVQTPNPNVPYVFAKNRESLEFTLTDVEYCGNANQNVRSVFFKDEYSGSSSNSLDIYFDNVTISSFDAPGSEVCSVINNFAAGTSITLLGIEDSVTTFSNNRGCINSKVINFNSSTYNPDAPTGDWRFNNNYANNGSAIYCNTMRLKDPGKYSFTGNSAAINGGAIFCTGDYNATGSVSQAGVCHLNHSELILRFEGNTADEKGGAIYGYESEIVIGGKNNTFINNRAGIGSDGKPLPNITSGHGGAIYCETSLYDYGSLKYGYVRVGNRLGDSHVNTFDSNLAYGDGGAIYSESTIEVVYNTSVKFHKNAAGFGYTDESTGQYIYHQGSGGAIYCIEYAYIYKSPTEFSENSASYYGGAIYSEADVYIMDSPTEFSENSAQCGGAIYSANVTAIYDSQSKFSDNKANQGGAIYTMYLEFVGDSSTATFTGNYGNFNNDVIDNACGNDLYLPVNDYYSPSLGYESINLAFLNAGSYSFDGGIFIERGDYSDDPYYTVIDESQITIAGRANDSTNYYQFRKASISNGGKLTAKLDEIEGVNGIIEMDSSAKLELNVTNGYTKKLTMNIENPSSPAQDNDLAVQGDGVIEKTGDGTLQILAEAEGLVRAESFVVSSGRLDYRGYYIGALEVGGSGAEAIFSPGNSVGDANVKGDVKIRNNGIALFEFGQYPGDDSNHDVLYITDGDFSAGNNMIRLYFENADADDWSYEGCKYLLVSGAGLPEGNFTSWLDNYTDLFSLLSEANNLYLVYPLPKPAPEPSTIALLLLGAIGLMYLRKRVHPTS